MNLSNREALELLEQADLIVPVDEVQTAVGRVAREISAKLSEARPLVLSVMGGAVVFTGQLLPLLAFPLDFDYVHVSRYGSNFQGGTLHWKVEPPEDLQGRVVLVLDDILDEGGTMTAIRKRVMELGATGFYSAVFADKLNGLDKPVHADFVGVEVPNRFVFGFGMDVHGAWRNLPAIYAVKGK